MPAADRRPGQDVPPGDLRRHPRPPRRRRPRWPSWPTRASARSTSSSSTSRRSRRRSGAQLVGHRQGDRDDRRRRRGAPRRGRPERAPASPRSAARSTTRSSSPSCASAGSVSAELRAKLAAEAFGIVAAYYAEIAAYLNQISGTTFPNRLAVVLEKVDDLRYGENPHQRARLLPRDDPPQRRPLADATQLRGDRPSFNNLLDLDTAYRIARDFTAPTVAIVKHTDPVGVASADELVEAYRHALETDAVAAFGGDRRREPRARRGDRPRDRRELATRRSIAPGLQPRGARASCAEDRASRSWPSRRTRPRACATTASRNLDFKRVARRPARRDASTRSASTAASSRSSPSAARPSRS